MTRELKLALIVGFAIVLTVAILVSDHLSKARQASLADIGAANATRVSAKLPEEPIKSPDELLPATLQPAMSVTEPVLTRSSETTDASQAILPPSKQTQLASTETDAAPVVIGLGSAALQTTLLQPVNSDATYARRDMVENAPSNQITPTQGSTPAEKTATLSPAGDAILKSVDEKKTAAEIKTEPKQSRTAALPIGPNDRTHTIAENESLYAISKRYYGTGNLWRQLAAANAGRVSENGSARVGTKILIPSRDSLLGKTDATRSAKTESKPATKPEVKPEPKAVAKASDAKARSYTVRPGDSLGRIAARELGSSKRLGEIAALNKMDPDDDLLVGAILKLPSK